MSFEDNFPIQMNNDDEIEIQAEHTNLYQNNAVDDFFAYNMSNPAGDWATTPAVNLGYSPVVLNF